MSRKRKKPRFVADNRKSRDLSRKMVTVVIVTTLTVTNVLLPHGIIHTTARFSINWISVEPLKHCVFNLYRKNPCHFNLHCQSHSATYQVGFIIQCLYQVFQLHVPCTLSNDGYGNSIASNIGRERIAWIAVKVKQGRIFERPAGEFVHDIPP